MIKVFIDNSILSHNADAIENAGINLPCDNEMNINISIDDYHKLCEIIDEGDIRFIVDRFDSLQSLADWLNEVSDLIANGYIQWADIKDAIEASGWEFNAADVFIAYDNNKREGVRYEMRGGRETAVVF